MAFKFGITDLEDLLEPDKSQKRNALSSGTIIGPDGSGKSILALHLASKYLLENKDNGKISPHVIYVSTDLSYDQARKTWKDFGLDEPDRRGRAIKTAYKEYPSEPVIRNEIPEKDLTLE